MIDHKPLFRRSLQLRRLATLEVAENPFHRAGDGKVQIRESEMRTLSQRETRQLRDSVDDSMEHKLEITPDFEHWVLRSESNVALERSASVPEPQGS
jgi:hypothetical protein